MVKAHVVLLTLVLAACARSEPPAQLVPSAQEDVDSGIARDAAPWPIQSTGEVVRLVLEDLASPAFGKQSIAPECITVSSVVAARDGSRVVVAGRKAERDCGGGGTNDEIWIFVRRRAGTWDEDYLGRRPECWKGVPPEIADAVAEASRVRLCAAGETPDAGPDPRAVTPDRVAPVVVRSAADLPALVGKLVSLEGVPTRAKQPTLLGVDIELPMKDGLAIEVVGILRQTVVARDPNEGRPKGQIVAIRGKGTYYRLENPATGTPPVPSLVKK